jgi:hypothetical protein
MFRGATISIIYQRSLLEHSNINEASAVSLMSNDVDRITFSLEQFNECWARLIELCIGITLLARQLGWVSVVPLVVVICEYEVCLATMSGDPIKLTASKYHQRARPSSLSISVIVKHNGLWQINAGLRRRK